MRTRALRYLSFLTVPLLLSACAGVSPQERIKLDAKRASLADVSQSLLVSGCVVRDEVGTNLILRSASQDAGEAVGQAARTFLTASGIRVATARFPLLCNGLPGPTSNLGTIADNADATRSRISVPIPRAANIPDDSLLVLAYQDLYRAVGVALRERGAKKGGYTAIGNTEKLELDAAPLALLQADLGNTVWLVSQSAVEVSLGKSVGVALLSGLVGASAAGSSGSFFYFVPVSGAGTTLALVRLDQKTLVWANVGNVDAAVPTTASLDTIMKWGKTMFAPYFDPEKTPTAKAIAKLDAPVPASGMIRPKVVVRPPPKPVVALGPAVRPLFKPGTTLTTATTLGLSGQADPALATETTLTAGASLRVSQGVKSSDGNWYYVSATEGAGWVGESRLRDATQAPKAPH